jgi:hypothetical protein
MEQFFLQNGLKHIIFYYQQTESVNEPGWFVSLALTSAQHFPFDNEIVQTKYKGICRLS